ncbi:MAG TPA: ImmA/IrrE family metallo-endopeptidase [Papillibacter sp.]|nr:ImmA/IrrE family metallo-endopeptidase [Papillibacter sp.]
MSRDAIRRAAEKLARRFGTRNPFEIAEGLGVTILYRDDFQKLKGLYRVIARNRFIFLCSTLPEVIQAIVCAHELGHDTLHRTVAAGGVFYEYALFTPHAPLEHEANLFAASLLLPDGDVLAALRETDDVVQASALLGTDVNLLLIKLRDMNTRGHRFRTVYDVRSDFLRGNETPLCGR